MRYLKSSPKLVLACCSALRYSEGHIGTPSVFLSVYNDAERLIILEDERNKRFKSSQCCRNNLKGYSESQTKLNSRPMCWMVAIFFIRRNSYHPSSSIEESQNSLGKKCLWANRVPQFIIGCGKVTEKFTFLVKNPPRKISPENKSFDTTNVLIELVNNQEAMFKKPLIPP